MVAISSGINYKLLPQVNQEQTLPAKIAIRAAQEILFTHGFYDIDVLHRQEVFHLGRGRNKLTSYLTIKSKKPLA